MKMPLKRTVSMKVAAVAALSALVTILGKAPFTGTITAVTFIPNGAITGATAEARTFTIINKTSAGVGNVTVATLAMNTGIDAAAFDEKAANLSGTPANLDVTEGDVLVLVSTDDPAETGTADPGGLWIIDITRTAA